LAEDLDINLQLQGQKQHRASIAKRLSGRPSYNASSSSIASQTSVGSGTLREKTNPETRDAKQDERQHREHATDETSTKLMSQILDWLHGEKEKRSRKRRSNSHHPDHHPVESSALTNHKVEHIESKRHQRTRSSELSDSGIALEELEQILAENMVIN
ncbi:MAG: hypothetical protein Q9187_009041, partial [Circinaria calcarea]